VVDHNRLVCHVERDGLCEEDPAAATAATGTSCCAGAATTTASASASCGPGTSAEVFSKKTVDQLNAEMALADVSFDYDMSLIRDDQRAILQKNADYLRRWTSVRVTVEGHADARGTGEYNLALGERRGNAVKDYMIGLGIAAERMIVISKGEESPLCMEETEGCYSRNRRGHFIITAK
jgi:peptidoglycan-associated lipoprotein